MHNDSGLMTSGSIWRRIIRFALPVLLGNLFQQFYNIVDSLVVGNMLGSKALAAVGATSNLSFMLVGFFYGMFAGAGVLISRHVGAGDNENASISVHTTVCFGVISGLLLTVFGVLTTPWMLEMMGTPIDVIDMSVEYLRIYFWGITTIILFNVTNGIFNATGDSRHPLYYLIISSVINIVLDLLMVGPLQLGVAGAALATVIAQGVSAALGLLRLSRIQTGWRLQFRKLRINLYQLNQLLAIGLPSGLQNSIISIANVVIQANINAFGSAVMAGSAAYTKIEGFAFLPVTSFSIALSTFIGQNLGAKEYDRARRGASFGLICTVVLAQIIGVLVFLFSEPLTAMFTSDIDAINAGISRASIVSLFYFLLAYDHGVSGVLRGAGKTQVPMYIMLAFWCIGRIAYVEFIVGIFHTVESVYTAYPVSWSISAIVFAVYYYKADWIHAFDRRIGAPTK